MPEQLLALSLLLLLSILCMSLTRTMNYELPELRTMNGYYRKLEIIGASTPNVPCTASTIHSTSEIPANAEVVNLSGSTVDHGFDRRPPLSAQSIRSNHSVRSARSEWSDQPHQTYYKSTTKETYHTENENIKKIKHEFVQQTNAINAVTDKIGEVEFGIRNNKHLVAAINEKFNTKFLKLEKQVLNIPNINQLSQQMQHLMTVVGTMERGSNDRADLESEKMMLEAELKRRKNGVQHTSSYFSPAMQKKTNVMQLASHNNSQSSGQLIKLPGLFKL